MKLTPLVTGLSLAASLALAEPVDLGEIQVESSTIADLESSLKTEPSNVDVIDEVTYEQLDPKTINDVLRTVPGITADVRTGDVVEIHMRGVGQQEFMWEDTGVAVVIDGVPVLQNGGKVKINLDNIESIKVIKGGASYLYGPNALAGAVIITTKKPKGANSYSVSFETGSYGYKNAVVTFNRSTDKYLANLNMSIRYEDGYWDMFENWTGSINGKVTYFIDDSSDVTVGIEETRKYEESTRGTVTGITEAKENPTGAEDGDLPWSHDYWTDIQKYFVTYNKDFSDGGNLMLNAYYYADEYNYDSSPQDLNHDREEDTYTRDNHEDISQYGVKGEYRNSLGKLAYMLGVDAGHRELDDYSIRTATYGSYDYRSHEYEMYYEGETSDSNSQEDRLGIYAEAKYEMTSDWTIIGNIRYDYEKYDYSETDKSFDGSEWTTTSTEKEDSFTNISYRIGTTYDLNENTSLFANVSTGFRNPRIQEMYAGDFDDGYENNPDLDTETTINYEIGVRGKFQLFGTDVKYEASIYQLDTKDIISKAQGTYYWGSEMYDNVGDARTRGAELSLQTDRSKKLAFNLAYTYMDAYYTSHKPFYVSLAGPDAEYDLTGNQLPRTPKHRLDLLTYYKLTDNWTLIAENYMQSSYYADETNLYEMPGYGIMNLQLRYEKEIKGNKFEFFVKVDNIFDKQYYRTAYLFRDRDYDGDLDGEDISITVDPGRVVYAGFKYKF